MRSERQRLWTPLVSVALVSAFALPSALAQSRESKPAASIASECWILLEGDASFSPATLERIRDDLAVGLRGSATEVRLAASAPGQEPVAVVKLVRRTPELVALEVDDRLTNKRLARDVDLSSLPPDGHTLALAQAGDELLRASWAELSLGTPKEPPPPKTPEVPSIPVTPAPEAGAARKAVSILARPEVGWWSAGQSYWGVDGAFRYQGARWLLEARFGMRSGFAVTSTRGRVHSQTVLGSAWVGFDALSSSAWVLGPQVGIEIGEARFWGVAEQNSQGSEIAGLLTSARLGCVVGVTTGLLAVSLDAGIGGALSGVQATSDGVPVVGAAGLQLWTGLAVGAAF